MVLQEGQVGDAHKGGKQMNKHGTLWVLKDDMLADGNYNEYIGERKVLLKKGEIIEWRYDSNNHFRTMDNRWFWVTDDVFDKHCVLLGTIDEKIVSNNVALTNEIWRLKLFTWATNAQVVYNQIKAELEEASK